MIIACNTTPLASRHAAAEQTTQRDITENNRRSSKHRPGISGHFRAYSGHIPGISGHIRTREDRRVPYRPSPDHVQSGPLCRMARRRIASIEFVACRIAGRRIGCGMARRRITSRRVPARVGTLDVPAVVTVRRAEHPSSAIPRPNSACNRRRHRRFTNVYSFTLLWRFMNARSAARLRRGVGRHLNPKGSCRTSDEGLCSVNYLYIP